MLCWIVLHSALARKQTRIAFGIWAVIMTFDMLWMLGYEWAMWQDNGCFTDDSGNKHCVIPIAQLLFGLIVAILSEIFIVWKLRKFSPHMGMNLANLYIGRFHSRYDLRLNIQHTCAGSLKRLNITNLLTNNHFISHNTQLADNSVGKLFLINRNKKYAYY